MTAIKLYGRGIVHGEAKGEAIVTSQPISFFGGLDPEKGTIIERGHELEGKKVTGKILVFPRGKGSTVGSYVIYAMKKRGTAVAAIVNVETEPIIAAGCVLANIPLVDELNENPVKVIETGDFVEVFADEGVVEVKKRRMDVEAKNSR
jgi:predicted aconitase with swiveling domain